MRERRRIYINSFQNKLPFYLLTDQINFIKGKNNNKHFVCFSKPHYVVTLKYNFDLLNYPHTILIAKFQSHNFSRHAWTK
jgi:uncharacterized membrane protein